MGNFLTEVKAIQAASGTGELKTTCPLINLSLAKIRELHGGFKSICDNFAINLTEFENIFSSNEATFAIWDADNNGLIDALELFAGIIIFSDSKAEDKIRFLFDLFDFNEIQSLSLMDLEFCVQCVLVSTGKIFGVAEDVSDMDVTNMMRTSFPEGGRITINQILRWASHSEEVTNFFKVFRMEGPEFITQKPLKESEFVIFEKHNYDKNNRFPPKENLKPFVTKTAAQLINNKRSTNFRGWLNTALQPIISYRLNSKTLHQNYLKEPEEVRCKLEWAYGIRCGDTKRPIQYVVGRPQALSTGNREKYEKQSILNSEEVAYFTASIVVLYNTRLNVQRFYLQHDAEVISLAVSNQSGDLIATGEMADQPKIHVWNSRTLDNYAVLKGLHKRGVHMLAFSNNDEYLITCGLTRPSAVIIYDWKTQSTLVSTAIMNATQDLFMLPETSSLEVKRLPGQGEPGDPALDETQVDGQDAIPGLRPYDDRKQKLVVLSLDEIVIFEITKTDFNIHYISFEEARADTLALPICGLAIVADHKNQYYRQQGGDFGEKKHIILTGHKDGKVLIWKLFSYVGILEDYKDEITSLCKCFEGIAIGTMRGIIYIWDNYLLKCMKTIELSALPFKILSYNIVNIDANQKRILVLTIAGDVIEIGLSEYSYNKIKAKRMNAITKINGQQKGMCILNQLEKTVMIGGDMGIVCSYDLASHDLIDVWNVGARVTSLACLSLEEGGSFIVAAGTQEGNLIIRQDWEEIVPRHHECGIKTINDIKFSKNGALIAVASTDKNVYLLQFQDNDYVALAACRLENGFPVSINFSEDSSKVVICTNQRKLLLLDPATFQLLFKVEEVAQCFWSSFVGRYPLITKSPTTAMIPISLGNLTNITTSGDENGNIYVWRSVDAVKDNIGVNLTGHTAHIQRLELTVDDKKLLSMGMTDQTLCQWKIDSIMEEDLMGLSPEGIAEERLKKRSARINMDDESLINELNFCFSDSSTTAQSQQVDQFKDSTVLIRGSQSLTINKVLSKMHFDFEPKTWLKNPAMALVLEHIYGVQTSDRRHSIMYIHYSMNPEQIKAGLSKETNKDLTSQQLLMSGGPGTIDTPPINPHMNMVLPAILGTTNYQNIANDASYKAIKYEVKHSMCNKALVYYTSRFGIVYNTVKSQQTFYQGHTVKISCITKHPFHAIVATGEATHLNPSIHIWDATTMETLVILKTSHKGGILHVTFSNDGSLVASIGMDKTFSLQVFQWQQGRTLAYRNTGYQPVFGIRFSPYDKQQIITCGYEYMAVWKLKGCHLTCKHYTRYRSTVKPPPPLDPSKEATSGPAPGSILLCMDFISFKLGNSIQSDVLFGTSYGEITTYCSGKHFVLNEVAHEASINVIRVTDQISPNGVINILTGGEDGVVKIWDASCRLLQTIDMRKSQVLADLKNRRAFGVQSLDIYICDKKNPKRVLAGLRCGEIMEAIVSQGPTEEEKEEEAKAGSGMLMKLGPSKTIAQTMTNFNFEWYSFLSSHSSLHVNSHLKKVHIAMHPINSIMASAGDDETLRMWDISKHQIVVSKNLGTQATCLAFSPDGSFLAVGLVNGVFLILDSKIEKLNFGTYMEEFHAPTLDVIMSPKEAKTAVITMKFSFKGDFLAVSYDNEQKEGEEKAQALSKFNQKDGDRQDTAFVLLYVNRLSTRNPGLKIQSRDPYVRMSKILPPTLDASQAHSGAKVSTMGVTQMDFSEDDLFLEMCSQKILQNLVRDYSSTDQDYGFTIWDIQHNQMVSDYEILKKIDWSGWCLSNGIYARFLGNQIKYENNEDEKKARHLEQCIMSSCGRFTAIDNAICGSIHGDVYLFRFPAMYVDKSQIAGFSIEKLKKTDMSLSRGYSGHTSMVLSTEIFEDKFVLTTSLNDQCIIQWRVEYEDQDWEMDFNRFSAERIKSDPFAEIPTLEKFKTLIAEIWNHRLEVAEFNQNINQEEFADPACELELDTVIGRRAYDRRNNIKIDCQDRIIYPAGSLMVSLQLNTTGDDQIMKQTFLRPEEQRFTAISPEVSAFALTEDKRLLIIGTSQSEANILVWEISTNMQLARLIIPNCCSVLYIRVAHDNKHLIVIGLTRDYIQVIMILEWTTQTVVVYRQILHSLPFKMKDVLFFPGSTRKFVTCGIQHMCFWNLSGRNLECQIGELTLPRTFTNVGGGVFSHNIENQGRFGLALVSDEIDPNMDKHMKNEEELENIYVTFLAMGFLKQTIVASGDDGFLYLWENERIIRRLFAHEGSIFAIDTNPKVGLIVSGGMEGNVILWRLLVEQRSNIKSLDKLKTFSLAKLVDPQQAVLNPEFNVQSVCLGYNRIVIGTRTGTIYETPITDEQKVIKNAQGQQMLAEKQGMRKLIRCIDHETPRSISIDMISSRIYILTQKGFFSVWSLQSYDVVFQKNYFKNSKALISFRLSNKVMLIFENEIYVLDSNPNYNTFDELPSYSLKLNQISDAKLNHNERILGVATTSAAAPEVTLYDTENGFSKMKTLYGFKSSIKYIDFSTDNYYLQCEDNLGEVLLFEIETQRIIHTDAVDFELEWLGEGLRSYSQLKGIHYWYSQSNKITQICKVIGRPIVAVGDELGTVRLFNYPNTTGEGYYQCYSDHLFAITSCLFSYDRRFFLSTSEIDRCIFKWRVVYNTDKIKKLIQEHMGV